MSETLDNEEDLQSYFNSLNKDIEDATDSFVGDSLTGDVVGEDEDGETSHKMLVGRCSDNETALFIDQDGNYFLQSAPESKPNSKRTNRTPKNASNTPSTSAKVKKIVGKINATKSTTLDQEENADYILKLDGENGEASIQSKFNGANGECTEPNTEAKITMDDNIKSHIYDFDENEESNDGEECMEDGDFAVPLQIKQLKLKPNSTGTNEEEQKCPHCDYVTAKHYLLLRHLKVHSDDRPYKCSVCERGFKTKSSLQNHMNSHLGKKPHSCKVCKMAFTTAGELSRHTRYRHTREKPHKCTECDYASVELSKLRRHIRCHTGERPYQCPHCTYASPDTFKLKRHLRTHTGEKPYECEICHARFTQSNSLKAHRLIHSVGDKPIFPCALCPTTCGRKTDLRLHVQKLHHSTHPIRCKRCGKDLPDRYSYKVHIKTHEGERCYKCDICPYASTCQRHLDSHKLVHTDQKPFVCKECKMGFRQQQLLKRHINLYHDKNFKPPEPRAKLHMCPHCTRTFTHKGNMVRHMEVHDPDSKMQEEKLQLKLSRSTRVMNIESSDDVTLLKEADFYSENEQQTTEFVYDDEYEENIVDDINSMVDEVDEGEQNLVSNTFEIIEAVEEEFDDKPLVKVERSGHRKSSSNRSGFTKCTIKQEPNSNKKIMAVEVNGDDDEQYMVVEIIQSEDDENEDDDIDGDGDFLDISAASIKEMGITKHSRDIDSSFDFQDDNVLTKDYLDSGDVKSNVELLDIIDDM